MPAALRLTWTIQPKSFSGVMFLGGVAGSASHKSARGLVISHAFFLQYYNIVAFDAPYFCLFRLRRFRVALLESCWAVTHAVNMASWPSHQHKLYCVSATEQLSYCERRPCEVWRIKIYHQVTNQRAWTVAIAKVWCLRFHSSSFLDSVPAQPRVLGFQDASSSRGLDRSAGFSGDQTDMPHRTVCPRQAA